jgi:hypothetical protein
MGETDARFTPKKLKFRAFGGYGLAYPDANLRIRDLNG